jgi:hypothetical protein
VSETAPCGCLGHTEVIELGGGALSYRQLNYWTANGVVRAHSHSQVKAPGTCVARTGAAARTLGNRMPYMPGQGRPCGWDRADAVRAVWIAQIVMATSMLPAYAAKLYDGEGLRVGTATGTVIIAISPETALAAYPQIRGL